MCSILAIVTSYFFINLAIASAPNEILILISSQNTKYHRQLCEHFRKDIYKQSQSIDKDHVINVQIMHEILDYPGDWNILTSVPRLTATLQLVNSKTKWIILCEDTTYIALKPLLDKLSHENHTAISYLGYALHDREASIIHHFAFFENPRWFSYPLLRSGVIFTVPLMQRIAAHAANIQRPRTEFSIDVSHELARFIMENVQVDSGERLDAARDDDAVKGFARHVTRHTKSARILAKSHTTHKEKRLKNAVKSVRLKEVTYICPAASTKDDFCVMYAKQANSSACPAVKRETIYFAIKTCHKFHQDRLPAIMNTWGHFAEHKRYFSDVEDEDIPTVVTGVPNAETGHCVKTLSILRFALKDIDSINRYQRNQVIHWIFLSDDDTLLSVAGVCEILGCFNPLEDVYLGERYGYRLHAEDGFNYITGGGGIILSLPVVRKILEHCTCPSLTAPDDMVLGSCLHTLQVRAIHSARFHQARPNDYSTALLKMEKPISFHKFWQLDPLTVWEKWFAKSDRKMIEMETAAAQRNHEKPPKSYSGHQKDTGYNMKSVEGSGNYGGHVYNVHEIGSFMESALHSKDKHIDL